MCFQSRIDFQIETGSRSIRIGFSIGIIVAIAIPKSGSGFKM